MPEKERKKYEKIIANLTKRIRKNEAVYASTGVSAAKKAEALKQIQIDSKFRKTFQDGIRLNTRVKIKKKKKS